MNSPLPSSQVAEALWLMTAKARGGSHWVSNAACQIDQLEWAGQHLPVSLLQKSDAATAYTCSPYSAWIRYPRDELRQHVAAPWQTLTSFAASVALSPLAAMMWRCKLDQAAIIGNHLVSTNLYQPWLAEQIAGLPAALRRQFPERPWMIRNLCHSLHHDTMQHLQQQGWLMLPARRIYLCDPSDPAVWKHNHVKQDAKLLKRTEVSLIHHDQLQPADIPALRQLFRQVFIHKHSALNPDFSEDFFALCLETRFLQLFALRYEGKLCGVLGLQTEPHSGWMTTPLIGYDTSLPAKLGLYRHLMALLLDQAREQQLRLHYSSGAASFKLARGGKGETEYTAIHLAHLPGCRQLTGHLMHRVLQQCAPALLEKADTIHR
ncbi:hypothetical protein [Undibacterium squillarum]|uniref:hypothetical protein n=1 Tax=Undibacterium squillarum TaxID=1131567 RepID=UPI0035B0F99D